MAPHDLGYFVPTSDGLEPVSEASSPWSPDMLHGRLLAGLAARAVEQHPDVDPDLRLARLTVDKAAGQRRRRGPSFINADHIAADGLAIGTCTLYDLAGPIGWSSVCAVANEVMGSGS